MLIWFKEALIWFKEALIKFGTWIYEGFDIVWLIFLIILLVATIVFSIMKIKKLNAKIAILVSSIVCSILMIPITTTFGHLVKLIASQQAYSEAQKQIEQMIIQKQNENLKSENQHLKDKIKNLEHAQLELQGFNEIAEIGLLETKLSITEVKEETIEKESPEYILWWQSNSDSIGAKYLGVYFHDFTAKFGFDLKEIKVQEIHDTLYVSGLRPKFIGKIDEFDEIKVSEVRSYKKHTFNKGENESSITTYEIENDKYSKQVANDWAKKHENEFKKRLSEGVATKDLEPALTKLGHNFISIILSSIYPKNKIYYMKNDFEEGGIPILDFINNKIEQEKASLNNLSESEG